MHLRTLFSSSSVTSETSSSVVGIEVLKFSRKPYYRNQLNPALLILLSSCSVISFFLLLPLFLDQLPLLILTHMPQKHDFISEELTNGAFHLEPAFLESRKPAPNVVIRSASTSPSRIFSNAFLLSKP